MHRHVDIAVLQYLLQWLIYGNNRTQPMGHYKKLINWIGRIQSLIGLNRKYDVQILVASPLSVAN